MGDRFIYIKNRRTLVTRNLPSALAGADCWPSTTTPAFSVGQLLATPAALAALNTRGVDPRHLLARHHSKDWGDVCAEDAHSNEQALIHGARLLSVYRISAPQGCREATVVIWCITEDEDDTGMRSATTLLLPSEY
jgi:hypothetical protein